jgi:hypothetical protein
MTTVVLALITIVAAATLVGVLWSIVHALRAESASARLRRDGVPASGTVVDNTMTSTTQRRLVFSPVVEFRTRSGEQVAAAAQQAAATSWARGATVEVRYDQADPERFVLAGAPSRGTLVANTLVGLLVVTIMAGTVIAMYTLWWQFRYDKDTPQPTSSQPAAPGPEAER